MEAVLWYVLTGTRGGADRVRNLEALDERPRNAQQLADTLELDYKTVQHHLEVLVDNDVLESSGDEYGAVYAPTDRARDHLTIIEQIIDAVHYPMTNPSPQRGT